MDAKRTSTALERSHALTVEAEESAEESGDVRRGVQEAGMGGKREGRLEKGEG